MELVTHSGALILIAFWIELKDAKNYGMERRKFDNVRKGDSISISISHKKSKIKFDF